MSNERMREALEELVDLVKAHREGEYEFDSFSLQPAEQALAHHQAESEPVEYWVLFDSTADKKYIKKSQPYGFLAFFDCEKDVRRAREDHPGTDYKRVVYYASPQPATQVPAGFEITRSPNYCDDEIRVEYKSPDGGHMSAWVNPIGGIDEVPERLLWQLANAMLAAAPSIAEKREPESSGKRTRTVQVGAKLFEFSSQQDWVNKGPNIWKRHRVRGEDVLVIDQLGRTCRIGKHFQEAEEDGAYPIEVFRHRPEPPENN